MNKTLYTAMTTWQGPYDSESVVYLAGITQKIYKNLKLVNSFDQDYPDNTAFKLLGTSSNDFDRIYEPLSTDNIILTNIDTTVAYGIDDDKNLLIFPESYPLLEAEAAIVSAKLIRNFASLYKANLVSFEYVNDFSHLKEKAITSMLATESGIFLAGVSGNIWFYDGNVISGPVFSLYDGQSLPATSLLKHRFSFEDEDYIYAASDKKPRLYRSKVSTAALGQDWEEVYGLGELSASSGGILSLLSAFDKIFMGCRNNIILKYSRTNSITLGQPTDPITESVVEINTPIETLEKTTLISNNVDDFESSVFDIKTLEIGRNQIFAGLSNKPDVWAYSEALINNPISYEQWANTIFDEVFRNDPAPAQYYSHDGITSSRNDNNLAISHYIDDSSEDHYKTALVIRGNTISSTGSSAIGQRFFEWSEGSDWEQSLSSNLPDQDFITIQCASTEEITSLSDIKTIDGYTLQQFDTVLLKDQPVASSIKNGIYIFNEGILTLSNNFIILDSSVLLGFFIQHGYINSTNRYLLTVASFDNQEFEIYKPKYTFEFETKNLAYSKAISCNPLEGCKYLNTLYNNDEIVGTSTTYVGYQGIDIADLYGSFRLEFNHENIRLTSGNNSVEKPLISSGIYKNWLFSSASGATSNGWIAGDFISSIGATIEATTDYLGNSYDKYLLSVNPAKSGNPSITISGLDLTIKPEAVVILRCRITPYGSYGLKDAKINLYWSNKGADFTNYSSVNLRSESSFVDYIIRPVWKDKISNIKIEFDNLPELSKRPLLIDIDYIKIIDELQTFDINNEFSTIRVAVEGKDIKVWLGKQFYPYFYQRNFIAVDNFNEKYINSDKVVNDYDKPHIRIGKVSASNQNSLFAFSKMSYIVGENYDPLSIKVFDFHHLQQLQASGGVRMFTYHDGTIYSVTDGFNSNKVNENPDDRQCNLFKYDSTHQTWLKEELTFERKQIFNTDGTYSLLGVVRPLSTISYKGVLYLSGQYGNIKVT